MITNSFSAFHGAMKFAPHTLQGATGALTPLLLPLPAGPAAPPVGSVGLIEQGLKDELCRRAAVLTQAALELCSGLERRLQKCGQQIA